MTRTPDDGTDFARLGDLLGQVFSSDADIKPPDATRNGRPGVARRNSGRMTTVPGLRRASGAKNGLEQGVAEVWAKVVGAEIAANTHPLQLRQGRLVVATSSPVWGQTLQLMSEQIQERLNRSLGEDAVREMIFRHAGWETGAQAPCACREERLWPVAAAAFEPNEEQAAALEEVERTCGDVRLREQIIRAMKAAFAAHRDE